MPQDESTLPDVVRAAPAGTIESGMLLRERYVLEEHVADGATAEVWRGFDTELRRTIAVKLLHGTDGENSSAVARFRREAVTAARLTHPGIVAVYDTGTDDTTTWLALEHIDGPDLLTLLRHHPRGLPDTTAAAIVEQAAVALGVAHQRGVVHRDVKPANLLVTADGVVKVSDFGVAMPVGDHVALVTDQPVGTAAYAAPEQLVGDVAADPRMDVFALGVVLFEALTGRAAFPSSGPTNDRERPLRARRVRADVDRALDSLVARATAPDPAARFRDAGHLAAALRTLVPIEPRGPAANAVATVRGHSDDDSGDGAVAVGPGPTGPRWRWWALVAAVLLSVGAAATIVVNGEDPGGDGDPIETDAGVGIRDVQLYDPYGSVEGDPGRLLEVVDGDPTTSWSTPGYPRPLRTLAPGVGVRIDLGEVVDVASLRLDLATPGVTVELLARDDRPPPGSTERDWDVVGRRSEAPGVVTFDLEGRSGRHWLVWFTSLRETGETWQASLTDVTFDPVDTQ